MGVGLARLVPLACPLDGLESEAVKGAEHPQGLPLPRERAHLKARCRRRAPGPVGHPAVCLPCRGRGSPEGTARP